MLSDPVAEAFGLIHRHSSGEKISGYRCIRCYSFRAKLDFGGFVIKIALNYKSQAAEKPDLFSQGIHNFPNLANKTSYCGLRMCEHFQFCRLGYEVMEVMEEKI